MLFGRENHLLTMSLYKFLNLSQNFQLYVLIINSCFVLMLCMPTLSVNTSEPFLGVKSDIRTYDLCTKHAWEFSCFRSAHKWHSLLAPCGFLYYNGDRY